MPRTVVSLALAAVAILLAAPARAVAQLITVTEVCTPIGCMDAANRPIVFRTIDNGVTFKGNLIDLANDPVASDARVHITVTRKYNCGTGCVDATLKVDQTFNLEQGRTFTVTFRNLAGAASVTMFVVRAGRMQALSQTPSTATTGENPIWGTPVDVTITGIDIGHAAVSVLSSAVQILRNDDSQLVFRTTANAGTSLPYTVPITVKESGVANMPAWRYIGPGSFAVAYRPITVGGCVASATATVPQLLAPAENAAISYANDPVKGSVTLSWSGSFVAPGSQTATTDTKYEYEVAPYFPTASTVMLSSTTRTTSTLSTSTSVSLPTTKGATSAKSATVSLTRDASYQWRVRAIQCASSSSPTSGAFSAYGHFTVK